MTALLFARTLQHAVECATVEWRWQYVGGLREEFRRPDSGECVLYVPDVAASWQNLKWRTRVYLGTGWERRNDAERIRHHVVPLSDGGSGFFDHIEEPALPPPRPRRSRDDRLSEIRRELARLEAQR